MRRNEDEFSKPTKRLLAERAGYRCSKPDCRRPQLGPMPADDTKSVNLGKAAHICAASPGGPRYDASQTSEERSSINNAIYLCSACAELIDKNEGKAFPVDLLQKWKREHEAWVAEQINSGEIDSGELERVVWQEIHNAVGVVGQAETVNITSTGLSYSDAREIALDVYKANAFALSEQAASVARQRVEELTDRFLEELKARNPESVNSLNDPGMQYALINAQQGFSRSGDSDLESLLVDILTERALVPKRSHDQLLLDESIEIASKITTGDMNLLALSWRLAAIGPESDKPSNPSWIMLFEDISVIQFVSGASLSHLKYLGLGNWDGIRLSHYKNALDLSRYRSVIESRDGKDFVQKKLFKNMFSNRLSPVGKAIARARYAILKKRAMR